MTTGRRIARLWHFRLVRAPRGAKKNAMRRALTVVLLVAAALASRRASAAEVTYALGWNRMPGAESCIGAGTLARGVEALLGRPAWVAASAADVQIEGYVEKRAATGWHAHLVVSDAKGVVLGQRDVANEETACASLDQPLTLMLALILDPRLLISSEPNAAPPLAPIAPPARSPVPPIEPPAPKSDELRGEAQMGVAVAGGILPGVATGLAVNQGLRVGSSWIEIGGTLFAPRESNVGSGRGASFSLLALTGRFCPFAIQETGFLVLACGGVGTGLLVGQGFGFDRSEHLWRPVLMASVSLEGSARIAGRFWAGARLGGVLPVLREQFIFHSASSREVEVFRMNPVGGTAEVTLGIRF
jgi:hypothetical protein